MVSDFATTISRPRRRAFVDVYRDGNIKRPISPSARAGAAGHVRRATLPGGVIGRAPVIAVLLRNGAVGGGGFSKRKEKKRMRLLEKGRRKSG